MTYQRYTLRLYEEVLVPALYASEGGFVQGPYPFGIAAGILAELDRRGSIFIDRSHGNRVTTRGAGDVEDLVLLSALRQIKSDPEQTVSTWIRRFASQGYFRRWITETLCQKDIVQKEQRKFLWFFQRHVYRKTTLTYETEMAQRIRSALACSAESIDARTRTLIAILDAADLLWRVLAKDEVRRLRRRIDAVVFRELWGPAIRDALRETRGLPEDISTASAVSATA